MKNNQITREKNKQTNKSKSQIGLNFSSFFHLPDYYLNKKIFKEAQWGFGLLSLSHQRELPCK